MLEDERTFYEAHKSEYLEYYEGQWVLIHGTEFFGAYSTEAQAYEASLEKIGNEAVFIQFVTEAEEPVKTIPALLVGLTGGRP